MAEQQQDVETLKRRGRRRLVGAIALVLLAVIALPMVFDPEPRPVAPPVSLRIPGEDETPFKPKPPAGKATQYFVPVGAFANPQAVSAKLDAAKLPYYTEAAAQGNVTRVRVGPFASREAADQAAGKLRELGLEPGAVAAK
jgi:DedD protein